MFLTLLCTGCGFEVSAESALSERTESVEIFFREARENPSIKLEKRAFTYAPAPKNDQFHAGRVASFAQGPVDLRRVVKLRRLLI